MRFNHYQRATKKTAFGVCAPTPDEQKPDLETLMYVAVALGGETGELQEKIKKYNREGDEQYLEDAKDELGDIMWYFARMADELGTDMDTVAEQNLDKLLSRQERNKLTGEGDNR